MNLGSEADESRQFRVPQPYWCQATNYILQTTVFWYKEVK